MFEPKGIIPAMITPLTDKGKINKNSLKKLVEYFIMGGIHGIFAIGTTGEFYGLSDDEYREVLEVTIDEVRGRVPVYAGASGITTKQVIKLANIAEEVGVDAVSVLTPMFISPNQEELYNHYKIIAQNTQLPILLYNNLPKTGVTVTAETVERLADIENIVGVKDSTGDFTLTAEYIRRTRDKNFYVLSGRDTLIHAALCYGGNGSIAACANVAPKLVADIYDKYIQGDIKGSLEAQFLLAPLRIAFGLGTFPTVIKESLEMIGIEAGNCMSPVGKMNVEERERLKEVLINIGVLK